MKKISNKIKRKLRNRKKLKKVNNNKYGISVSKSLNNLSAQIIDDTTKKRLFLHHLMKKILKKTKLKKLKNLM